MLPTLQREENAGAIQQHCFGLAESPVVALTLAFRVRWQKWNIIHCIPEQGAQY